MKRFATMAPVYTLLFALTVASMANAADDHGKIGGPTATITVTNETDAPIRVLMDAPDGTDASIWVNVGETKTIGLIDGATFRGLECAENCTVPCRMQDGAEYVVSKETCVEWEGCDWVEYAYYDVKVRPLEHELANPLGITVDSLGDGRYQVIDRKWGGKGHRLGLEVGSIFTYTVDRRTPDHPSVRHPNAPVILVKLIYLGTNGIENEVDVLRELGVIKLKD